MRVDRRRLLLAAAAGCLVGRPVPAAPMAVEAGRPLAVMRRWPTRDNSLVPLALDSGHLAFAGASTLGIIRLAGFGEAPADTVGLTWQQAHGLSGGAAFRPRFGGDLVLCGGPAGLAAWEIATGRPRWRYPARVQVGVPFVGGQRVYCGDGHEIVALDLDSGRPLWRFAGTPDTLASYAPAGVGDQVFAGPGDGRLYALSIADGTPLWVVDRREDWQYLRQLHCSGDLLVAGSYQEALYGLEIRDGRECWVFHAGNFINSHHVADGTAYLWSPTGWVYAIDAQSGQVRWRHRTTDFTGDRRNWAPLMAELTTWGDVLYALAMDQVVHRLDRASGKEMERLLLPEPVQPAILPNAAGLLFASTRGDVLLVS